MNDIDLLPHASAFKIKIEDGAQKIWDPIRKKYYVLTPEEMVRQCIVEFLIQDSVFSKNHISIERGLKTKHKELRFDLLVYQKDGTPALLIECKAPSVSLSQLTFDQIAHYNSVLKVPYLWISNGHQNMLCKIDWKQETFEFVSSFPFLKESSTT